MSCSGRSGCLCGACLGTAVETPVAESNPPGQPAIAYRAGTWSTFKNSMLARLSSSDYPALAGLRTRDDSDFTIALIDATAQMLDVLTFYQERLANENYLRTAQRLRSAVELSRLIGYQPAPGVGAQAYLAFTLKSTPGQPDDPTAAPITIPAGSQVQSVPGQGQTPQIFETSADIQAKSDWNALAVQSAVPWTPQLNDPGVYLAGTATQLQPGDAVLIVGDERVSSPASQQWDVRTVASVAADTTQNLTYVTFDRGLGYSGPGGSVPPAQSNPKFYAFGQKAAFFGASAPDPNLFVNATSGLPSFPNLIDSSAVPWKWQGYAVTGSTVYLDAPYPNLVAGADSWIALSAPSPSVDLALEAAIILLEADRVDLTKDIDDLVLHPPYNHAVVHNLEVLRERVLQEMVALEKQRLQLNLAVPTVALYQAKSVAQVAHTQFSVSAKVSALQLTPAAVDANVFGIQDTAVLAQSEELPVAAQPLDYPLYGLALDLEELRPDLAGVQVVAISGPLQKVTVMAAALTFIPRDGSEPGGETLKRGAVLAITDPTPLIALNPSGGFTGWSTSNMPVTLSVQDAAGRVGTIANVLLSQLALTPSVATDPQYSEYALVANLGPAGSGAAAHTQIQLQSPLANCYDRTAATVNANTGLATQGQSVSELLGSGDASATDQTFTLKQFPLTYVQAATPTGAASTLEVMVNGVAWTEVPSLFGQGSAQPVFATLNQADSTTDILFGDGTDGAVLPTGQNNLSANYRIGSGSAGNVAADAITTLMDRPLGVSGVTNPQPATGGVDPESAGDIQANAPTTVLTLGRAVSILDYQNFALTFAGIAKAYALWVPSGPGRGVFLTVAGNGGTIPSSGALANLTTALQNYGNPLIPIVVQTYLETTFGLTADVCYEAPSAQPAVGTAIQQALAAAFSFDLQNFGEGVTKDEVAAVIQAVPGVVAVNVTKLFTVQTSSAGSMPSWSAGATLAEYDAWVAGWVPRPASGPHFHGQIRAFVPVASSQSAPQPAEILVLDSNPASVTLGVMA